MAQLSLLERRQLNLVIVGEKKLTFTHNNQIYRVGEKIKITENCAKFIKAKTPVVTIMGITEDNIYVKVNDPYSDSRIEYALQTKNIDNWIIDNINNNIDVPAPLANITLKTVYEKPIKYHNHNALYILIGILSIISALIFRGGILIAAVGVWVMVTLIKSDKQERKHVIYSYEDEKSK